jgi:large subunit ribosomal protein L13
MEDIKRNTHTINAEGQKIGRLATSIATVLQGKNKPTYTPNVDSGDVVEVVNVEKMEISDKKASQKSYYDYSGYPRGLKAISFKGLFSSSPEKILIRAVSRMLPKNRLHAPRLKRLIFKK